MSVQAELVNSLYAGFVDYEQVSLEEYRPKLLVNDYNKGQKVLTSISHAFLPGLWVRESGYW